MRTFDLARSEDVSGVSGTGVVAQGVMFDDGTCAMRWLTETASTAIYSSIDDLIEIHSHGGKTEVRWHDKYDEIMSDQSAEPVKRFYVRGEEISPDDDLW